MDMCEQKLAPNFPYIKTIFLGWFEPFRDAIAKEQELCQAGKIKASHAPFFDQLPADMMAVITMHNLVSLLMAGGEHGSVRVVHAAISVGDAVEHEVRIYKFLEKTKKKKGDTAKKEGEDKFNALVREQDKLQKKVTDLMKKKKLVVVRKMVKGQDDMKPWGQDNKARVGSHLIEILLQIAYIQHPSDQPGDCPHDIRPAFFHSFRTVIKHGVNSGRK